MMGGNSSSESSPAPAAAKQSAAPVALGRVAERKVEAKVVTKRYAHASALARIKLMCDACCRSPVKSKGYERPKAVRVTDTTHAKFLEVPLELGWNVDTLTVGAFRARVAKLLGVSPKRVSMTYSGDWERLTRDDADLDNLCIEAKDTILVQVKPQLEPKSGMQIRVKTLTGKVNA